MVNYDMYDRGGDLLRVMQERIVVLDGAMGTMIQQRRLSEDEFRGTRFAGWQRPLKGCNDVLVLTCPDVIAEIHKAYLDAGADVIETNSFNANAVSLADYGLDEYVGEINREAARLARKAADKWSMEHGGARRWVAGSVGSSNRSLSISPSVEDPSARNITWDELVATYACQIASLIEGGVDAILIETVFDTLNAKAALWAAREAMKSVGVTVPVMVSATLTESGRTLSGQTLEAFLASISHASPACIGLNCGFGAEDMAGWLARLSDMATVPVIAYPNAGLPNEMGEYDETPEIMARHMRRYIELGLVNMVGGCCGSTPDHIRAIAAMANAGKPRLLSHDGEPHLVLSGLEAVDVVPERNFINIGERCNVAGSRKFLRLINEGNYDEALSVARRQVEAGAQIIDVNMDDAMLDARHEMVHFLRMVGSDPDVARVPVMIDSSKWEVIEAGLKELQGKGIVNSISLKDGEKKFVEKARFIRSMGAAMVVMAFDEQGQADTFERRVEVCSRAYKLLTEVAGVQPTDIIFDPNVLAIATGIEQHDGYAADFLRAVEWIKANLPGAKVSGGVSNLSFSFRGNNYVREAMHSVFLYHAIVRGLDMAIVNAAAMIPYEDVPGKLREAIEDVIFNRDANATDRLIALADEIKGRQNGVAECNNASGGDEALTAGQRLERMIVRGATDGMDAVAAAAMHDIGSAFGVINGPLMRGMDTVGTLFGQGKMFLPQVVKSARAMKHAVAWLNPYIEAERSAASGQNKAGRMVIATVKGDVHDIGKNIVSIVMRCNGFEVIDLGVMVPGEEIVKAAVDNHADIVALSGLITPSLEEMCRVARLMEQKGMRLPLMVGGATTSDLHTAVKIAPEYVGGVVVHTRDAAAMPVVARRLLSADRDEYIAGLKDNQTVLRRQYEAEKNIMSLAEARSRRLKLDFKPVRPKVAGIFDIGVTVADVAGYVNWKPFFGAWQLVGKNADAAEIEKLRHDAIDVLEYLKREAGDSIKIRVGLWNAYADGDDIVIDNGRMRVATLRQQHTDSGGGSTLSLADFIAPHDDYIGTFAVTVGQGIEHMVEQAMADGDDYRALLLRTVADRLAEAATELMHRVVATEYWGYGNDAGVNVGIRPAVGYPSLPDQSLIFEIDHLMPLAPIGIRLTENGAMYPAASTCGLIISHPESHYFILGAISEDQRRDYAARRGMTLEALAKWLR